MFVAALTSWAMHSFVAGKARDSEPAPRVAIDAKGHTLTAWTTHGRLVASADFHAPRTIARGPDDYAVAPGALAYQAKNGLHVVIGRRNRVVDRRKTSEIDGVAIAADPQGGWAVAERLLVKRDWQVRVLSLAADGTRAGAPQDLGAGDFGVDARPTQALVVKPDGTALFAYESVAGVFLATRPHGGPFTVAPVAGKALSEPRITGDTLTALSAASCGDAGCAGRPVSGTTTLSGPQLRHPGRAFAPWGTADGLVFLLKERPRPFSREAPVRLYAGGRLSYLTHENATEPFALALKGRTLALWATRTRWEAASIARGRAHRVGAPPGHTPSIYHSNASNRDARAAGERVIVGWARKGVVHFAVRRFPAPATG